MFSHPRVIPALILFCSALLNASDHAMEALGKVSFPISCRHSVQQEFNRGVAMLHSFTYMAAEHAFVGVSEKDSGCAMAHWGIAMTYFHQLWEPAIPRDLLARGLQEVEKAQQIGTSNKRERGFIEAANLIFKDADVLPYGKRVSEYQRAMAELAERNPKDVETQVFYALALLANASPADKTHTNQKKAADILEPLYRSYPDHPGMAHYLIHAYDNAELAPRGLAEARAYSKIAPDMPHALHMPSHIFTRLGLWDDSIASNAAARKAAREMGDIGEELHAMDYLVYAYLQAGREAEAAAIVEELKAMPGLNTGDFKVGYAATVMPIRYLVERQQWADAARITAPAIAPPHVTAIAIWARGLGIARRGEIPADTEKEIEELARIEEMLRGSGNNYWAVQVGVLRSEVMAWTAQADKRQDDAVALLRKAADEEDSLEKLPVTPGPVLPAREQLGALLMEQGHPDSAAKEFEAALELAPGRRGAAKGLEAAEHASHADGHDK